MHRCDQDPDMVVDGAGYVFACEDELAQLYYLAYLQGRGVSGRERHLAALYVGG